MIVVRYNRIETTLTVKGHAGAAPEGKDIVCAAASILAFTADACAKEQREKYLPTVTMNKKTGDFRVACRPGKSSATPCRRMLDVIFTGFEILASAYPDFVRTEKED